MIAHREFSISNDLLTHDVGEWDVPLTDTGNFCLLPHGKRQSFSVRAVAVGRAHVKSYNV